MNKISKLLSIGSDAKTIKGAPFGYSTAILYLAPHKLSGINVCPNAEQAKCHIACLNTAGRGKFTKVQQARVRKTKMFFENRSDFLTQLHKEVKSHIKLCDKNKLTPCFRLNGTSDIRWENYGVIEKYPEVQFYDYTKITNRKNLPKNYHLTWSYSNANKNYAENRPDHLNWAIVFGNSLPEFYLGRVVHDGDVNDLRFLDPPERVIGLSAKGKAKKDRTGFVQNKGI